MVETPHGKSILCHIGGKWSSTSEDMICHLASQDHMIEGSYDFMVKNFSLYVTTQPSLANIGIEVADMFLISHLI